MQLNPKLSGLSEKSVLSLYPPKKRSYEKGIQHMFLSISSSLAERDSMRRFDQHQPPLENSEVGLAAPGRQPVPLISIYIYIYFNNLCICYLVGSFNPSEKYESQLGLLF